jgi:hypothetical protein
MYQPCPVSAHRNFQLNSRINLKKKDVSLAEPFITGSVHWHHNLQYCRCSEIAQRSYLEAAGDPIGARDLRSVNIQRNTTTRGNQQKEAKKKEITGRRQRPRGWIPVGGTDPTLRRHPSSAAGLRPESNGEDSSLASIRRSVPRRQEKQVSALAVAARSRFEGEVYRGGAGLSPSGSMFPVRTCVHAGRRWWVWVGLEWGEWSSLSRVFRGAWNEACGGVGWNLRSDVAAFRGFWSWVGPKKLLSGLCKATKPFHLAKHVGPLAFKNLAQPVSLVLVMGCIYLTLITSH